MGKWNTESAAGLQERMDTLQEMMPALYDKMLDKYGFFVMGYEIPKGLKVAYKPINNSVLRLTAYTPGVYFPTSVGVLFFKDTGTIMTGKTIPSPKRR